MTFQQLQQFLGNFNVAAGTDSYLTGRQYLTLTLTAGRWYGKPLALFMLDCFGPTDKTGLRWVFLPTNWKEVERRFQSYNLPLYTYSYHPETFEVSL
jgi:hypothetical protein